MNRKYNSLIFLFILLLPLLFINIAPVIATEEENVDSFDVHPANRWTVTDTSYTTSIDSGLLNLTDIGDGTADSYAIARDLRDLDGKIETRFKISINESSSQFGDKFEIRLQEDATTNSIIFSTGKLQTSGFSGDSRIDYRDTAGNVRSKVLTGDERVATEIWYYLKIDYNLLTSDFRWRLFYDNDTKVFDYQWQDLSTTRPEIFDSTSIQLFIRSSSFTNGIYREDLIDYVKAPFKERQWTQSDTPGDADWLEDSFLLAYVQDDIQDTSGWILDVPNLDVVSGSLIMDWSDRASGNFDDDDTAKMGFQLFGVDGDDGDLHDLIKVSVVMEYDTGGTLMLAAFLIQDHTGPIFTAVWTDVTPWDLHPRLNFVFTFSEDRSRIDMRVRVLPDAEGTEFKDFVATIDVASGMAVPSQEFLMLFDYFADFTGDVEVTMLVEDFGFTDRDIFTDIVKAVVDPIGNFLSDVFTIAFRFLAGIFRIVGDLITAAMAVATEVIDASIGLVVTALDAVNTVLGDIFDELAALAAAIATEVWDGISDTLQFITDAIADIAVQIWTEIANFVDDILDDLLTAMLIVANDVAAVAFAILEFLIVLVLDIIDGVIDFLIEATFFFWDLLGLPDLIAIYDTVIVGLIQVATSTPDMFIWLLDVWFFWATGIFFLGFLLLLGFPVVSSKTPGELINNFRDMNSMDATLGVMLLGFQIYIPIGFVFWPTFFLMFLTPLL